MSPVRRSANERSAPLRRAAVVAPGAALRAAAKEPVRRQDGELEPGGDEAVAEIDLGEAQRVLDAGRIPLPQPRRLQAREVVGRALALAALRPGHERAVAGAHELLELGLGLLERARGEVGRLRAELQRLVGVVGRQARLSAGIERGLDRVRGDVELVGVRVVERGADVLPVVGERGLDLLLGGDQDGRVGREVEERAEAIDRQQLRDVGERVPVPASGRHI